MPTARVMRPPALALLGLLAGTSAGAADNPFADLVPHRAIYELKLAGEGKPGGIAMAQGKLVLEFIGDACDGFTTTMRIVTNLIDSDGKPRLTDVRTSTFEGEAGKTFDFLTQTFVDQRMAAESKGVATRHDQTLAIALERPRRRSLSVDAAAVFPTEQTARILTAARAGKHVVELVVYEGSENGDKVFQTTTVIGRESVGPETLPDEPAAAALADVKRWPVTISYFDADKKQGEDTPDTQLSFTLYDNGVTRKLRLDYGDFALDGRMVEFTPLDRKPCP